MIENEPDEATQRKQRIGGMFDRAAPTYDLVGPRFFSHFGEELVRFAQMPNGARVLDLATGRGAVLFPAARTVGLSGHVIGTDISEPMVNATRQEIRRLKLKNINIEQMDAESLKFPDESFDYVLCGFALFFFPHLERALSEMRRVLRPDGLLAVSTWEEYDDEQWRWFDELVKTFLPPEEQTPSDPTSRPPPPRLDTPESMGVVLTAAGFVDVECKSEQYEAIYRSEEEWWETQWSHGGRLLLERIESTSGVEGLERFRKAVFEGLAAMMQADGIHAYWPALFTKAKKPKD